MEAKYLESGTQVTEKLYYNDSHLQEFTATVLCCEEDKKGYRLILDRTAFFPEGGGQFGDTGWIGQNEVLDTREKAGIIYHIVKDAIEPGTQIAGRLDYAVRFERMQQHSGEHIVSGIVHQLFGYDNVGFHLGNEITTLDFNGELTEEQLREVEKKANQAVFSNLPIEISYPDRQELAALEYRSKIEIDGQVRIVTIPGYDVCACCAPHVKFTGEIGLIKLVSCDRHRGGCRVVMLAGIRALRDYQEKLSSVTKVSVALSAKPDRIGDAVLHLKEQQSRMREQLNALQAAHLKQRLDEIHPDDKNVCIFEAEMDSVAIRNFVNDAMEKCSGICGAFVGTDETGYRYILGSKTVNLREFSKELNKRFQGKGGGKPEMVQGSLIGCAEEIEKIIMTF